MIAECRRVCECAVLGIEDAKSGEAVKAFVVLNDPTLALEEILLHYRQRLATYKVPREIAIRPDLPKSSVGKILRVELRK